jgi:S1-C subfamily serine protease
VTRGYLGVRIQPLTAALARNLNLPGPRGALVVAVQPDSPAQRAGVKAGDVVVKIGDEEVGDPASLRNLTANLDVGAEVPIVYYRDGKSETTRVTVSELPSVPEIASLGFHVRDQESTDGGVRVVEVERVEPGSPAFQAGLRPGIKILAVGREPVHSVDEFEAALHRLDLSQGLPLFIQTPDGRSGLIQIGGSGGQP